MVALLAVLGCSIVPPSHDFSDRPLPEAIDASVDTLADIYSLTRHKQLDWEDERARLVAMAQAAEDDVDRDRVIRHLVGTMPDAHVQLWNDNPSRNLCPEARGAYPITLADLDDGSVIVAASRIPDLEPGDRVIGWNGRPVTEARQDTALHCFPVGMATHARVSQVALRLLARDTAGATADVEVRRHGQIRTVELVAEPDGTRVREALGVELPATLLDWRMLPGKVGYIVVGWEETWLTETRFQRALVKLHDAGATSLIVDLRDNDGGTDGAAANIAGLFTDRTWFYETITFYDRGTGRQRAVSEVYIRPQEVRWRLPVVVLVNANTVSSGEGLAWSLRRVAGAPVVGFEGTAASFASTGAKIHLPRGWTLHYPMGRSLDRQGRVQIDSDHTGEGGVVPDVRVPWTAYNRIAQHNGGDPVLDAALALLEAP